MTAVVTYEIDGPLGRLRGAETERGLALLALPGSAWDAPLALLVGDGTVRTGRPASRSALRDWFAGTRRDLADVPVDLCLVAGFTRRVLECLRGVPHGTLVTYGELARRVGSPGAARAVGGAVGANPVPVVVPCHRVVAAGGRLGGFGGGLAAKRVLLELEGCSVVGAAAGRWSRSRVVAPRDGGATSA